MKRRLIISLVGIVVIAFGLLALNLGLSNEPLLGLDLQGGASVTLRPATSDYDEDTLKEVANLYREKIEAFNIGEAEVVRQGDTIVVNLPGVKDKDKAIELIGTTGKVTFRPVLQAYPGFSGLTVPETGPATTTNEPQITVSPTTAAPGSEPTTATAAPASATTAATATTAPPGPARAPSQDSSTTAPATTGAPTSSGAPTTTVAGPTTTNAPFDPNSIITPADQDLPENDVWLPDRDGEVLYHLGPVFADGESAISSAEVRVDQQTGVGWEVVVTLTSEGLAQWNQMASACFNGTDTCPGRGMAIIIDHRVISAPVPQQPSFSDTQIVISNDSGFKENDARQLGRVLKYGASPIEMKVEASQTVSATLGSDTMRAAIISGVIGVALVVLFMLLYYKRLAFVVAGGLIVSTALIWSTVVIFDDFLVLTLAGVLGVIVSVGITVDSYVVYFERLKDEVRNGRSLRNAAQRGFRAAWRTILAANFVALLSALVLWYLSVGSVRGFALFLGVSTLVDLIVTYFFTRPAVYLLAQRESFQGAIFGHEAAGVLAAQTAGGGGS